MKYIIITFCIILASCSVDHDVPNTDVIPSHFEPLVFNRNAASKIHFTEGFSHDRVEVLIDGSSIFSKKLTTPDDGTGLAKVISFQPPSRIYEIVVHINSRSYIARIRPTLGSILGLQSDSKNGLTMNQSRKAPIYN